MHKNPGVYIYTACFYKRQRDIADVYIIVQRMFFKKLYRERLKARFPQAAYHTVRVAPSVYAHSPAITAPPDDLRLKARPS